MDQNRKQDIALMRYSAISPLVAGTQEDFPSLSAFFRDVSARGVKAPDGQIRHYAPATIARWYLDYRHGGFEVQVLPVQGRRQTAEAVAHPRLARGDGGHGAAGQQRHEAQKQDSNLFHVISPFQPIRPWMKMMRMSTGRMNRR